MALFCLVHGSTQNASGWDLLALQLHKQGHQTLCVDLQADEPDAPATRYAEVIAHAIVERRPAELPIVVAHSVSGLFLPILPTLCLVSKLVFLAAFVPEIGTSPMKQFRKHPTMFCPDWIGKDPINDDAVALQFLFHNCPPETARWALTTRKLMYVRGALTNAYPLQKWPDIPISYILCRQDRTLCPEFWCEYVRFNLGITPVELAAGHCPHISCPDELAGVLSGLA